jgi:hypothetical protein
MPELLVECRIDDAGSVPARFGSHGAMREVSEVIDRWMGEDHAYYRVRTSDGAVFILRRDDDAGTWAIHFFEDASFDEPSG